MAYGGGIMRGRGNLIGMGYADGHSAVSSMLSNLFGRVA